MKPRAHVAAVVAAAALSACGGSEVESQSSAATLACTTQTLTTVFTTDCSTATGYDAASCLAGTPPVCAAATGTGCSCVGEGTNLWAAVDAVGLCGRNAAQTRASLQSALCGAEVLLAKPDPAAACSKIQSFEASVWAKQAKGPNKDIAYSDGDTLRQAAQAVEAAITAAGTECSPVTAIVP